MALKKLTIRPAPGFEPTFPEIKVMFNPNSYSISKTVAWRPSTAPTASGDGQTTDRGANAPAVSFGGGDCRQLTLELFFDTTELPAAEQDPAYAKRDVRQKTDPLVKLTRIQRVSEEVSRPPVCSVQWGEKTTEDFPFIGTVSSLTQRFVLFTSEGIPLRATLNVTFKEFLEREADQRKTDPEMTTRTVRRGDSLSSIAAELYRDAGMWRVIAEFNRVDDPLRVPAGLNLVIPKVERQKHGTRKP